jgi:hypothetical protein
MGFSPTSYNWVLSFLITFFKPAIRISRPVIELTSI